MKPITPVMRRMIPAPGNIGLLLVLLLYFASHGVIAQLGPDRPSGAGATRHLDTPARTLTRHPAFEMPVRVYASRGEGSGGVGG